MNPYIVLGVPVTATDAEIRAAYLNAIKKHPPDAAPEKFQEISSAYSRIQTEEKRIEHTFFNREAPGDSPVRTVLAARRAQGIRPMSAAAWQSFIRRRATKA